MPGTLSTLFLTAVITAHAPGTEQLEKNAAKPAPVQAALHPIQLNLIERTNAVRTRHGVPPLRIDMGLVRGAERHTAWMTNSRTLQHSTDPVGENIALGQRSVAEVVSSWMSSPGHRANMLSARYHRIGVSAYRTPDGSIYWCQQFAP